MKYEPHHYQQYAIQHLYDNPNAALFLQVGLGKSSITLTALEFLLGCLDITKPLIIGPKRVISHTWPAEIKKWDHLHHLKISVITGTEKERVQALYAKADIYAVSRDNISWLVFYCSKTIKRWPFDVIVLDELSNFKNPSAQRFKAVRKIIPYCKRVIGLTGTPAPNQLLGLWAQVYLLDQGKRLGLTYGKYKDKYFMPGARNGHVVFNYIPKKNAEKLIFDQIKDICVSMKTEDYLELPPRYDIYEEVELESYERYKEFKRTEILQMKDGEELTPVNTAALYNLLLQYCNGAIYRYDDKGKQTYEVVDNSKLEALIDDVEALDGDPVFIAYQFKSDLERIQQAIPQAIQVTTDKHIDDWNAGNIAVACAQVQSLAYGVNLQHGGNHLSFFGLPWDLELYIQFIGRLDRQGKTKPTIVKHFVAKDSIEQLVIERLKGKAFTQDQLMLALKRHLR